MTSSTVSSAVRAEIVDEAGAVDHLVLLYAEVLDDDLLNAVGDVAHGSSSFPGPRRPYQHCVRDRSRRGAQAAWVAVSPDRRAVV
jgi:hypothetical protein